MYEGINSPPTRVVLMQYWSVLQMHARTLSYGQVITCPELPISTL
jgi:hypothetical protein